LGAVGIVLTQRCMGERGPGAFSAGILASKEPGAIDYGENCRVQSNFFEDPGLGGTCEERGIGNRMGERIIGCGSRRCVCSSIRPSNGKSEKAYRPLSWRPPTRKGMRLSASRTGGPSGAFTQLTCY